MAKFEDFDRWIEDKYESKTNFAEKIKVSKNTVSLWCMGKSQIKGKWEKKIRAMGYDGPLPKPSEPVTAEDLQALGRDLVKVGEAHRDRVIQEIQVLGAAVRKALAQLGVPLENPQG